MIPLRLPSGCRWLQPCDTGELVRVGPARDGGYVLPAAVLSQVDGLLSLGLGEEWEFELDYLRRSPRALLQVYGHSVDVHGFLKCALSMVKWLPVRPRSAWSELWGYYRRYRQLQWLLRRSAFFPQRVYNRVERAWDVTPQTLIERLPAGGSVLVKMDIEGAEYRVLPAFVAQAERFPCVLVEFHDTEPFRVAFEEAVGLLRTRYEVVHLHGNNYAGVADDGLPDVLEMTFVRRDLCAGAVPRTSVHLAGLDFPNRRDKPDYLLQF